MLRIALRIRRRLLDSWSYCRIASQSSGPMRRPLRSAVCCRSMAMSLPAGAARFGGFLSSVVPTGPPTPSKSANARSPAADISGGAASCATGECCRRRGESDASRRLLEGYGDPFGDGKLTTGSAMPGRVTEARGGDRSRGTLTSSRHVSRSSELADMADRADPGGLTASCVAVFTSIIVGTLARPSANMGCAAGTASVCLPSSGPNRTACVRLGGLGGFSRGLGTGSTTAGAEVRRWNIPRWATREYSAQRMGSFHCVRRAAVGLSWSPSAEPPSAKAALKGGGSAGLGSSGSCRSVPGSSQLASSRVVV
mmetsp:Transcript_123827/g.283961  ORF Transcript_123827/g.283961 Transcript_123827/m.283961 type:complete len:311 (-) Transcript_123827:20-952(-)